jgi:hypothetical protein
VSSGASAGMLFEEFQILDSLNHVQCSYTSPKFGRWHSEENYGKMKVILYSDTTITSHGSCEFVELQGK